MNEEVTQVEGEKKKFNSFIETVIPKMKGMVPDNLINRFLAIGANRMGVSIELRFPCRVYEESVLLKEVEINFKNSGGYDNSHTLNIQLFIFKNKNGNLVPKTKYAWSRLVEVKNSTKMRKEYLSMDVTLIPEQKKVVDTIASLFGFTSSKEDDIMFPF